MMHFMQVVNNFAAFIYPSWPPVRHSEQFASHDNAALLNAPSRMSVFSLVPVDDDGVQLDGKGASKPRAERFPPWPCHAFLSTHCDPFMIARDELGGPRPSVLPSTALKIVPQREMITAECHLRCSHDLNL